MTFSYSASQKMRQNSHCWSMYVFTKRLMKRGHSLHLVNLTEVFVKAVDAVTFPIVLGLQRCEYSKQLQECMESLQ